MLQGATIAAWSRTQKVVALSSGEAEYIALAVAAAEARWLATMLEELGLQTDTPTVWCDSAAARDMCKKNLLRV